MIRTLAIPPPQIRPSIEMDPERKAEDAITQSYIRILNSNIELQKANINQG